MKTIQRRLSTNEKLAIAINAKEVDDAESFIDGVVLKETKAQTRLRRTVLYNQGSRALIPKTKVDVVDSTSPYDIFKPREIPNHLDTLDSSFPPGAHEDAFRRVQFKTERSRNDPERVFFTTTSCTDGIKFSHQPPWYYGYENKTKPADSSILMAASRYGFRGSKDISQRHTNPYQPPNKTRTEYTPKFLDRDEVIDEWVPPILAAKYQTVNNMESPKLWPENTEFVTGYPLKKAPSLVKYNRETTIGLEERPQSPVAMSDWMERSISADQTLREKALMERSKSLVSLPMQEQMMRETSWNDRVIRTANSALRATMKHEIPPYDPHTLVDPTDVLRYAKASAMIVHTQTNEELQFRLRMQRNESVIPYDLRWMQIFQYFRMLKGRLKRDQSMGGFILDIASTLRREGTMIGTPTSLNRLEFIAILHKTKYFEATTQKSLSLLFSVFDPTKRNSIRFVELISGLAVLDIPMETTLEKLGHLWSMQCAFGDDQPALSVALSVFCCCCNSESERKEIETVFKEVFRPTCYKNCIDTEGAGLSGLAVELVNATADPATPSSPPTPKLLAGKHHKPEHIVELNEYLSDPRKRYKNKSVSAQAHNICDDFFSREKFVEMTSKCPKILSLFDRLLSARYVQFYGKDGRYTADDSTSEETVVKDFKWILSRGKG